MRFSPRDNDAAPPTRDSNVTLIETDEKISESSFQKKDRLTT